MQLIRNFAFLVGLSLSWTATAWSAEHQYSDKLDPGLLCKRAEEKLPRNLEALRKLDHLLAEAARPNEDYCQPDVSRCEILDMKFMGFAGSFLLEKKTGKVSVLTLTISHAKWRTLEPVRVGASLHAVEAAFAVKAEPRANTLKIIADCTPLDIEHDGKRVTKASLDCQACI